MNLLLRKSLIQLTVIISVFSFLILKLNGFELYVDSYGYIENHIIRSSFYPLFLDLFYIFGESKLLAAAYFQVAISIFAFLLFAFRNKIIFKYNLVYISYILISLVLISNFSKGIITEAIAVPIFVLFLTYVFQLIEIQIKLHHFLIVLLFLLILVSIRNQFLFLFPAIFIYMWFKLDKLKMKIVYSLLLLIPIILSGIIERNYHKIKHNQNVSSAYTGLQLLPSVIYNSNLSDSQLIDDRNLRLDFISVKRELMRKNIDPIHMDTIHGESPQYLFTIYFNVITHRIIKPHFLSKYSYLKNENEIYVMMDKDCMKLFEILTKNNYKSNAKLYFNLFKLNGFNNLFFLVAYILIIIFVFIEYLKRKNQYLLLLSIALISLIFNQILVTLVSFVCYRYMVYNYIFIFLVILVIMNKYLIKFKRELVL